MGNIELTDGKITSPKGFRAASCYSGIGSAKSTVGGEGALGEKGDLALIVSDVPGEAAAVFTRNKVKSAHIKVMKEHIKDGKAQAIICNSGNANCCTVTGETVAEDVSKMVADGLGINKDLVMPASTGVIGVELSEEPFRNSIPRLINDLSKDGSDGAAMAIMTTDTKPKTASVTFFLGGKKCVLSAVAKGSGMIHINMGTMLSFMTTDAAISAPVLQRVLEEEVKDSYNQVTIDGDTSTNDTLLVIANGLAGNDIICDECEDLDVFREALHRISVIISKKIAEDGEGATKLLEAHVKGAPNKEIARKAARSVISSDLVKTAFYGEDANWGRILCAIGYADGNFSCDNVDVDIRSGKGSITVCRSSGATGFSEDKALEVLKEKEVTIEIDLNSGDAESYAWGCDLTHDYVKINGEYRT